jgi:pyruvate/2-oxoglutarate dehydrogenase complex dihydrolipoamide dehydrogenase (E3) component
MRRLRARISRNDSAARFEGLGVDVYFGKGQFVDSSTLDVDGARLRFKRAVIATGSRPAVPPIPGLDSIDYLTNETLFTLTELPRRLCVIGAGAVGCEMAQAFARLGSTVFLVESEHGVLPREDRAAAGLVQQSLIRDGVTLVCCARRLEFERNGEMRFKAESHGGRFSETIDKVLVAAGRMPNVESLNLDRAGVAYDGNGVIVNDRLQTSNRNVFAAGDVCSQFRFTHAADFMARIVIQNALFLGRAKASSLVIPWCTYTAPELAHIGLTEETAKLKGIAIDTFVEQLEDVDRAVLDGEENGFIKVHVRRKTDRILGATIVARNAGDLIGEIVLAMTHRLGLKDIGKTIHPYPTQAEAIRKLGDQFNRTRLSPTVKWLLDRWLAWMR